jgi:uncharacterized protein
MSDEPPIAGLESPGEPERSMPPAPALIVAAYRGNLARVKDALKEGADVDFVDPATGLSALHIAVGTNDLVLCRYLIDECGASIRPDRSGRWPTLIAAQCRVSDELGDYIAEKEASALPAAWETGGKPS